MNRGKRAAGKLHGSACPTQHSVSLLWSACLAPPQWTAPRKADVWPTSATPGTLTQRAVVARLEPFPVNTLVCVVCAGLVGYLHASARVCQCVCVCTCVQVCVGVCMQMHVCASMCPCVCHMCAQVCTCVLGVAPLPTQLLTWMHSPTSSWGQLLPSLPMAGVTVGVGCSGSPGVPSPRRAGQPHGQEVAGFPGEAI